ncbi:MAG: MFS transporter [Gemmataceae bacterium]
MSEHFKGPGQVTGQPSWGTRTEAGHHEPGLNEKILFWASFFTLIAAGMGFSIRGDIIDDWGKQFGFTQGELGIITGQGLAGFGLTIIFFSFFSDILGYGKLMVIAFLFHAASIGLTLAAPYAFAQPSTMVNLGFTQIDIGGKSGAYLCLWAGAWAFSLGNGTCEAVINPLTATLFPKNKTHWLNILHAGWPGGLVLGAVVGYGLNKLEQQGVATVGWMVRWGIVAAPVVLYGVMMLGRRFPRSEAETSGVSMGTMVLTLLSPILLFLFLLHAMVGYVELGTDTWIQDITKTVLRDKDYALLAFIWTNVLMFTLRFFAGPIVHKISPVGLLFFSAVIGAGGLWMLGQPFTDSLWPWMAAVTVYGIGKTFYWPTMLGVISERYPQGGALALGISGGIGMISAGFLGGPGIGYKQDYFAKQYLVANDPAAYQRYKGDETSPLKWVPAEYLPPVAGLDKAKVGILNDNGEKLAVNLERAPDDANYKKLNAWWQDAKATASEDKKPVDVAMFEAGKKALEVTAVVPAAMAVGFLLLLLYFLATGGYKQKVLDGHGGH